MTATVLAPAQLEVALRAFGVGQLVGSQRLEAGTINSNYRVDVEREGEARSVFLRVNEGKTEADVVYEVDLVTALAGAGVPTPPPIRTREGAGFATVDGMLISLFPWISGTHRDAEAVSLDDARAVGRALAVLHDASAPLLESFDRAGIYTTADIAARYESFRRRPDPELADAIALIGDELDVLEHRQADRDALPAAIIHGDLFRDNVLWRGDELVGLIDFEQASRGAPLYDLAVCINAWCFVGGEFNLGLVSEMTDGYGDARPWCPEETRDALVLECRAAAVRFAVTRITDVHLAGLARPGKSFTSYIERLERLRELGPDGLDPRL